MALILAALLAAAPEASFAPPVDRDLRYETVEERTARGRPVRFVLVNRVRFARVGSGYRMDVTQVGHESDAPLPGRAVFDAAMAGFQDVTVSLFVTAEGAPGGIIDGDAVWARILAAQRAALAAFERRRLPAAQAEPIRRHFAGIAALDRPARDRLMGEWARDLLAGGPGGGGTRHANGIVVDKLIERDPATGLARRIVERTSSAESGAMLAEKATILDEQP